MDAAEALRQADGPFLTDYIGALFRYADEGTFVSLRAFYDTRNGIYGIRAFRLGRGMGCLVKTAQAFATECANAPEAVVFAPPVATFANDHSADEASLANGLALSVECDRNPYSARKLLEALLGPATVIVASGGEWTDDQSGEVQDKLHLHWRLSEPTRDAASHKLLKRARTLAAELVGGDATNKPVVHPIRWPGTWHRKRTPRLSRIVNLSEHEVDLQEAVECLQQAAIAAGSTAPNTSNIPVPPPKREERAIADLIREVLTGKDYHAPIAALAMRLLNSGLPDRQAVAMLRGIMLAVPAETRDQKGGVAQPGRWQARFDDIPRAVSTARAKLGTVEKEQSTAAAWGWPEPLDFLAAPEATGAPKLRPEHLPDAIAPFVFDTAERMGADPAAVALTALVALASVMNDEWCIQPKEHDTTWTENPRLWGAIVGDPSILKTPILKATTRPIDAMEAAARAQHADAMQRYKAMIKQWKDAGSDPHSEPKIPQLHRYMVEGTTVEALSEALRDDPEAKQKAPMGKVLARQDEMSEWIASFDRYRSGGRGSGDRGAYLRLYNGGRYTVDRVGRGSFAIPNWSACVVGGIQPGPIQRLAGDAADDGLLQRFCYCVPARQLRGQDRKPNDNAQARYQSLFTALAALHPGKSLNAEPCPVVLHADAHRHRLAILDLAEAVAAMPGTSGRLKAALGKWSGLFARLALVFHLIEAADTNTRSGADRPLSQVLQEATARRVAAYMREVLLPHLLRAEAVMFATEQTGHARWIAGFILSRGEPRITLRDVVRAYGALRAPERHRELSM